MLHEIAAAESDMAPATAFALALAATRGSPAPSPHWGEGWGEGDQLRSPSPARPADATWRQPVIWIAEDMALLESGAPYGPGLVDFGIAPERVITVSVAKSRDVIWALEEALRCRAISLVIGEVRSQAPIDLTITRRLSLAAARGGAAGLLLRAGHVREPSAAATRWMVAPAPSRCAPHSVGPPSLLLRLTRNRRGRLGSWKLEWNRAEQCFSSSAHFESLVQSASHRPARAAAG
jgi:protein ImuA